jgi:hypothetical protein
MAETGNFVSIKPYKTELMMMMMMMTAMMRRIEEEEKDKEGEGERGEETKGNILYITTNLRHCLILQLFQNSENHTHR